MNLNEKKMCRVAGWGSTRTHGGAVNELQVVDVPIINLDKCQKAWHNALPVNVICAGGYGTNKGFCQVCFLSIYCYQLVFKLKMV